MKPTALYRFFLLFVLTALLTSPAMAQPELQGDYGGRLGPLRVKLHIVSANGALSGTLDSVDQGITGVPATDFHVEDGRLTFSVPRFAGQWTGTIADGGETLAGTWNPGNGPLPVTFLRESFVPAAKPSPVDGIWLGLGIKSMRVQITVKSDAQGREHCTFDSIDQDAFDLPCAHATFAAPDFTFEVPTLGARYAGKLSAEGSSLAGTFSAPANNSHPLNMTRQATALMPEPFRAPVTSAAIAPVDAAHMKSTVDRDFAQAAANGWLAPQTHVGVTIGVLQHGVRRVFAYGTAKPDSIYEIGSVTKTFTGLIMACMIVQGEVKLDEPIRELLPPDAVAKPAGREILLQDLVTHRSGLPRMPNNIHPADEDNPYADYGASNLYQFIGQHGVARPDDAAFLYSNLGFGLLGQVLADRAGVSYEALVQRQITGPLGMKDTTISLTPAQRSRFIAGHNSAHFEVPAWDHGALVGAGGIRSTADDLLTFMQAQLHPEKLPAAARTLARAIPLSQEVRDSAAPAMHIAFAWMHEDSTGMYEHNGAEVGYSSDVFFNPREDTAVVVLVNTGIIHDESLAELIAQHIAQRFAGKPAIEP